MVFTKGMQTWNKGLTKNDVEGLQIISDKVRESWKTEKRRENQACANRFRKYPELKNFYLPDEFLQGNLIGTGTPRKIKFDKRYSGIYILPHVLYELYWEQDLSQRQIGERFGISQGFVGKQMKLHNFPARSYSEGSKLVWKRPGMAEKIVSNLLKATMQRPTSYEQKIIDVINEYNFPFKYVGDGEVIIGFKNPDFIDTNNQNLLIEVYAKFWHPPDYENSRSEIFAKYGFKTLFVNEDILNLSNWKDKCKSLIDNFIANFSGGIHG